MERFESIKNDKWNAKHGWEIIKEFHTLSRSELREMLESCSSEELDTIEAATMNTDDLVGELSDGVSMLHGNAAQAGMKLNEFNNARIRIDDMIQKVRDKKSAGK